MILLSLKYLDLMGFSNKIAHHVNYCALILSNFVLYFKFIFLLLKIFRLNFKNISAIYNKYIFSVFSKLN